MTEISVRDISREEYSQFLDRISHSAFHRIAWLDAVSTVYALRIRLLGYFRDDALLAVTPLMGRRIGPLMVWGAPLRKCGTPPATPFCSPYKNMAALVPHLHAWVTRQRLGFVQITIFEEQVPEAGCADRLEPLDNLELDLQQPLETIWRNMAQQKSAVRKAVRSGVCIHWHNSVDMLSTQQTLVAATYGKQGIHPNIPERLYKKLLSHRADTGSRVLCATHAGQTVAAVWILSDSQKCYYWDAAALDVARDLNANHLLVWCLIRWAHRKRFKTLDFVGAGLGRDRGTRPGIGRFKRSMGAVPVSYRIIYWYSPPMHAALACYRVINRLRVLLRTGRRDTHANPA